MPDELTSTGPVPGDFAGESFSTLARRLFHATRPKFFPASVLPILAGTAWGVSAVAAFDATSFALALGAVVLELEGGSA